MPLSSIEAASLLKMRSYDLLKLSIVDRIIPEKENDTHPDTDYMADIIWKCIYKELRYCMKLSNRKLLKRRCKKYIDIGQGYLINPY